MTTKQLIRAIVIMFILIVIMLIHWYAWAEYRNIIHKWFDYNDPRQDMVWYAYKLWWLDFVLTLECENWNRDINQKWDRWRALGLCQLNNRRHKWTEDYKTKWQSQVETCYEKRSHWTKMYWPKRKINWQLCRDYVLNRFILIDENLN